MNGSVEMTVEGTQSDLLTLSSSIQGDLLFDEPMSKHTSWRVGGNADYYFKPANLKDLSLFLKEWTLDVPCHWVGLGSNLLVRDGGVRGLVIVTSGMLNELDVVDDNIVRAEAGVACPKVAKFSAKNNLLGAEFLSGIPGTVGGALRMNAGAFGGETWERIESVETLDKNGITHVRIPADYEISYRHVVSNVSEIESEWFVAAKFKLSPGDGEKSLKSIKALLERRNETQPTNQPSCGSVFRNPGDDYAARLIESCGFKGHTVGGACVSKKHANFIVNLGHATAEDIEILIELVRVEVKKQHGIDLIQEAHVIGEAL